MINPYQSILIISNYIYEPLHDEDGWCSILLGTKNTSLVAKVEGFCVWSPFFLAKKPTGGRISIRNKVGYIYIIYIWIYGTCFSQSVSHQFSQTIPMARKRKKNIYMDIFQLEVTGNIDVSIPNSNTKSGNHEELKLRFRLIFYCSYVKSSHVRYGL